MIKVEKNKSEEGALNGNKIKTVVFLLGVFFIVSGGIFAVIYSRKNAEIENRDKLVKVSDVTRASFDPRQIVALQGNIGDLDNPAYLMLRRQMVPINGALENFGAEWMYLMKNDGGRWIFYIDPTDESAFNYTPPGTPYDDYPKELDSILDKKSTIIVGPYSDQWGKFVSIFDPIKDPESGEILGVLGIDIDAEFWKSSILKSQIFPATSCFFALMLWILVFFYLNRKSRYAKELQLREERFRSIAEKIDNDVVYRMDLLGKITYISPSVKKISGFSQGEIVGKSFENFIPPVTKHSEAADALQKLSRGEQVTSLEIPLFCKNGKIIQADINISPIFKDGKMIGSQGIIRDITQRKKNEEAIRERTRELEESQAAILNILEDSEEEKAEAQEERDRTNAILYNIGEGVFAVDEKLRIVMINKIIMEMSGCSEEQLIGEKYEKKLQFFINDKEKDNFLEESLESGKIKEISSHSVFIGKDGKKIPVSGNSAPLKNKEGKIKGCVVVFGDVTKEKEIERMKSDFVSVTSHQLRTPLTKIRWSAEMLLEGNEKKMTKEQREFVEEIYSSDKKMIKLVGDLLDVSRIESGKSFTIETREADVISIVKETVKDQEMLAEENGIKIIYQKNYPKGLLLNIDGNKIKQVFQNLLINAIEYSPKGKSVILGFEDKKKEVVFSVKDSGPGIPADQQKRVFDKFFRASNVLMTEDAGTGLGLYISKSIAEFHGGKIWFDSEENEGTTFYFSLPKK